MKSKPRSAAARNSKTAPRVRGERRSRARTAARASDENVLLNAPFPSSVTAGAGELPSTLVETVEQLKQSEAMVRTLFRISKRLNSTLNVGSLLDTLAQEAIQIVGGESGFAGPRTADGMTIRKYFRQGQAIRFEHAWLPDKGIPGWILKYRGVGEGTGIRVQSTHDSVSTLPGYRAAGQGGLQ